MNCKMIEAHRLAITAWSMGFFRAGRETRSKNKTINIIRTLSS